MGATRKVLIVFWVVLFQGALAGISLAAGPLPPLPENPSGGAITRHSLQARIDPSTARLEVVDTLTIAHLPDTPATKPFPFLLAKGLVIEEIRGLGVEVSSKEGRVHPRELWFKPPYDELEGYERARSVSLLLGQEGGSWPASMRIVVRYAGVVYDSLRPPEAAYARGFETTSGLIDPRGAYMSWGSFWIPQRPDERFTFRCTLETPSDWHGVSQGKLVSSEVNDGSRVNVWDCPHPMEEVYFIAGPYTLRQKMYADVEVMTFTYANTDESISRRYIDGTGRYLDLYGELIGPYPFSKFALIENFWQTGFGMPSFTLLGDRVIRLPFILDTSYGHEILHNWWGNGVFVDYLSGNWCEGLTAYGADYLYKEQKSAAEARDYRRTALQGYLDYVSEQEDMPLRRFRQRENFATQAIGYSKSMMVFHQVRSLLGKDRFWAALQDFYRENLFVRASWDDLFEVFGRHAGRDLSGWKEQWLERTGAPSLELRDHRISGSAAEGYLVVVTVAQTQPELYELAVPVAVGWGQGKGGSQTVQETHVVRLAKEEATVTFELPRSPDWIAVDPAYDVLRRIDPAEIPPALSRTLGADTAAVIIADGLTADLLEAYRALAEEWDGGARLAILLEADLDGDDLPGVPVWFFGAGERARREIAQLDHAACRPPEQAGEGWKVAGVDYPPGSGIVLAGGPPDRPQNAWSLIDAADPNQVAALGRKVPHYGKYGYLVFNGRDNVAKGSWEIKTSPLRVSLAERDD